MCYRYQSRGDAHVGNLTASEPQLGQRRDCLHWCHAPGVLDALALSTLHALDGLFDGHSRARPAAVAAHVRHLERHSGAQQDAIESLFKQEHNLKALKTTDDRAILYARVMAAAREST